MAGVLKPGDETGIAGLLDKEAGIPAKDIGAEQTLDGIQDFRMAYHPVDPGEEDVAAMAHFGFDRASAAGFIVLEPAAKIGDFARVQSIDRKMVATTAIGRDLILAQQFWHGSSETPAILLLACGKLLVEPDPAPWCCQEAADEAAAGFFATGSAAGHWQSAGTGFRQICFARTIRK